MGVSKVNYGNTTLVDLTQDTITPDDLLQGVTAHNAAGDPIVGRSAGGGGSGGHTIVDSDGNVLTARSYLQFDGINVEDVEDPDDPDTGSTIVHGQLKVCATEAEWNALTDEEKDDPNTYWVRPWATPNVYASDKLPVGTVVSVTGDKSIVDVNNNRTTPFPTDDYFVCNGASLKLTEYPKLAQHFIDVYGSATYFGSTGTGYFSLPDFHTDFPTNGLLCIKAQISVDKVAMTELQDDTTSPKSTWSSEQIQSKITELNNYIFNTYRRTRKNITALVQNGTFDKAVKEQDFAKYGIAIGDFFTDNNGYVYHLADPNSYYGGYNNNSVVGTYHVALVVDTKTTSAYNATSPISGSYESYTIQTYLRETILPKIRTGIAALTGDAWSDHLLSHKMLVPSYNGSVFTWGWTSNTENEYITTMTETQVFGGPIWSADGYQQGEGVKKLAIFDKFRFNELFGNVWIWLRSLSSPTHACGASDNGAASYLTVTTASGRVVGLILYKAKS